MSWQAWLTVGLALSSMGMMIFTRWAPDVVFVGAVAVLLLAGVIQPEAALAGLANPGLATVGVLYVVVSGLVETGAVHALGQRVLGHPASVGAAQVRLMLPVAGLSAFLNNTPLVAMMVPVVQDWCKKHQWAPSKLMIPLSYAAILGGTCTLIGTSTNLVVHGLVMQRTGLEPMGLFDIAKVGLPSAVIGLSFVLLTSRWLLPDRQSPLRQPQSLREYTIELIVQEAGPLVGRTLEEGGLRHLPGAYLVEIERQGTVIPAVGPRERIQLGDRLVLVGTVESMVELVKIRGLVPAADQLFNLGVPRDERMLVEAVISATSPMVGTTPRAGHFRTLYGAVVVAVARNGERLSGRVGDIELRPGDTLLLEARPTFVQQQRNSRDFLLVSAVEGAKPPRHERSAIALGILVLMVALASFEVLPMLEAALLAACLMVITRCTTAAAARTGIDWSVLLAIAASLSLGNALESTGAANAIAHSWLGLVGNHPWVALLGVYLTTSLFTEFVTNNAAAVLVFPIAQATAADLGVSFWPFVVAIMMAASASFATPIGYQTNLMVYGPGGYRFTDYLRIGLPLHLLMTATGMLIIPLFWNF